MSKFLPIGTKGELLNSDMIARIIPKEDGGCIILTKDGQHFHSEIDLHDEVNCTIYMRKSTAFAGLFRQTEPHHLHGAA